MLLLITLLYKLVILTTIVSGLDTEVVVLRAVRGREARLPCGQGRVFLDGPDSYVLWLKNDQDMLYRFPTEDNKRLVHPLLTGPADAFREDETALLLKQVGEQDGGMYRCRVHYQASPSVDYVIDVRLVDSPGVPKILNEDGEEITKGFVGPLSIGSSLNLTCEVKDEQVDTLLYWRRNGVVIERAHAAGDGVLRAELHLRRLGRADLDAHFECMAQNGDVTEPLASSVVVRMYLPPLSVEIRLNNNPDFEAGQPRVVDCVVIGCVPPPTITWHLGDTLLRPSVHKELHDGNYTVSSLTLAPSLRDNGHRLVCRAHNPHLPTAFEHSVVANVGYRPVCLTNNQAVIGVMPRQAETVTCVVEAVPEPLQVSWTFASSRTLYTSVQKVPGHLSRYTSTLTWLPRTGDAGPLQCRATNSFGEQKQPCEYEVREGGPPAAVRCSLRRAYPTMLAVQCYKGWDGGRSQNVHLELAVTGGRLLRNLTCRSGEFRIPDIPEDVNLTAKVYASNERGRSEPTVMHLETVGPMSASAVKELVIWEHWAEVAAGAVVVAILVAGSTLLLLFFRAKQLEVEEPDLVPRETAARPDGSFHREPDFTREERVLGTTNITVNQLSAFPNVSDPEAVPFTATQVYYSMTKIEQTTPENRNFKKNYTASPVPACRVLASCGRSAETCPNQQAYYV